MKTWGIVIFGLAALVLAFLWRQEGIASAKAEAETAELRASIIGKDSVYNATLDTIKSLKRDWEADTLRLTVALRNATIQMRQLRGIADSLSVVAYDTSTGPVEQLAAFRQLAEVRLQEVTACRVALSTATGLYEGCTGILARTEGLLAQGAEVRVAQDRLIEALTKRANPSLFQKVARGLPYLGAGVVLGMILTR